MTFKCSFSVVFVLDVCSAFGHTTLNYGVRTKRRGLSMMLSSILENKREWKKYYNEQYNGIILMQ